jgi:hypothetical protein
VRCVAMPQLVKSIAQRKDNIFPFWRLIAG